MHRHKYYCPNCGFVCKGSHKTCPNCHKSEMKYDGTRFRQSSKKRKNPRRIERNKQLRKIINNNPRKIHTRGGKYIIPCSEPYIIDKGPIRPDYSRDAT